MNKHLSILLVLAMIFSSALVLAADPKKGTYTEGEVKIIFKQNTTDAQVNYTLKQFGTMIETKEELLVFSPQTNAYEVIIQIPKGTEKKWIAIFSKQKYVDSVEYILSSSVPQRPNNDTVQEGTPLNSTPSTNQNCPQFTPPSPNFCPNGDIETEKDSQGCSKSPKCFKSLSNGRKAEIKIMPSTASDRAIERLGQLNFTIQLKEVGNNQTVYEMKSTKEGKLFGLFKKQGQVEVNVDAESGNVVSLHKPWWAAFATGI